LVKILGLANARALVNYWKHPAKLTLPWLVNVFVFSKIGLPAERNVGDPEAVRWGERGGAFKTALERNEYYNKLLSY